MQLGDFRLQHALLRRPRLRKLTPVAVASVDAADYFPASARDRDEMFLELRSWIASIGNPHLKALLEAIFADEEIALAYRTAPAAKSVHHAWIGGLIEHVLSLCHLTKYTAAHYKDIDIDLLLYGSSIIKTPELAKVAKTHAMRPKAGWATAARLGHHTPL